MARQGKAHAAGGNATGGQGRARGGARQQDIGALEGAAPAGTPTDIPLASEVGTQGLSILSDIANRQSLTFTPDRAIGIEIAQRGEAAGRLLTAGEQRQWDWGDGGLSDDAPLSESGEGRAVPAPRRARPANTTT